MFLLVLPRVVASADNTTLLSAEGVFQTVAPAVVFIVASGAGERSTLGSGVVVDYETVATNCHVIEGQRDIVLRSQGHTYGASVLRADTLRDLCLLSVKRLTARPAKLASARTLRPGQRVFALGNPRGLELTISDGLVSGLRAQDGREAPLIQTSAPISPGSSGGGLFDEGGRLVGITTRSRRDSQNLNFAIPADWIVDAFPRLGIETRSVAAVPVARAPAGAPASALPTPGTDTRIDVRVAPAPAPQTAKLQLFVSPWGEVYVNGRLRGTTPPLQELELPPGRHRLEIRSAAQTPYSRELMLEPGASHTIHHAFTK